MKYLDVRWPDFFRRLDEWDALRFDSRRAFLSLKPSAPLPAHALEPAARKELLPAGWVEPFHNGFKVAEGRREFCVAMRALDRVPVLDAFVLDDVDPVALLDRYFKEHLTLVERQQLSGDPYRASAGHFAKRAGSTRWIEEFLELCDDTGETRAPGSTEGGGEQVRRELRARRLATHSKGSLRIARELVLVLLEEQRPWSLESVVDFFVDDEDTVPDGEERFDLVGEALGLLLGEALVLASLDGSARPLVGLWEPAARTLARRTELAREPLETERPREVIERALIIEDLVVLLHECALDPPRVKADQFELFARNAKLLQERLFPLPPWLARDGTIWESRERVVAAKRRALALGLVRITGTPGKDQRMIPTETGEVFVGWSGTRRVRWLIDSMKKTERSQRPRRVHHDHADYLDYLEDDDDHEHDDGGKEAATSGSGLSLVPQAARSPHFWRVEMLGSALDAFRAAAGDSFVLLGPFLERRVVEDNPYRSKVSRIYSWITEEDADQAWLAGLSVFFFNRLVGLGAVAVGETPLGYAFKLTSVGRYLLGLEDDFEIEQASEANVVVQPNLELVFLGPSASARLECSAFAEPTTELSRGDVVGTLFRLTKASVQRAAAAGYDTQRVLETLRSISSQPVPGNVEAQISAWLDAVRWADVRSTLVLEVADAETAARVLGAVGGQGRLLADTVVEVGDWDSLPMAVRRKLVEAGIFVREDPGESRRS